MILRVTSRGGGAVDVGVVCFCRGGGSFGSWRSCGVSLHSWSSSYLF